MGVRLGEVYRNKRAGFDVRVMPESPPYRGGTGEYPFRVDQRLSLATGWKVRARALRFSQATAIAERLLAR